jgi:hypothetical protein
MDRRWVSFLYSYPNYIPLGPAAVEDIVRRLEPWRFDRIYGAFGRHVRSGVKHAIRRSAARYVDRISKHRNVE